MEALDLRALDERLTEGEDKEYWIHLDTSAGLDKYPAKQHARAAAAKLGVDTGLIYLAGAPTVLLEDSDQAVPFRQRRYFYYLSGSNESDNHLLYDIHTDKLTLYIPKIDLRKAVWGGAGSTKSEAEELYDVDSIAYLNDLETDTKAWWKTGNGKLYLLHPIHSHAIASLDTSSPRIDATTLQSAIDHCRVIKDDYEINLIRRANKVSADAHRAVLKKIRSFENESQVEGIFLDTCVSQGAHNQSYNIIAGSGSNASVLHYGKNDEPLAGRQVLLIDAGAEWNCYASDVTRTFPLSGTWTKEAKAIYDIVEEMQETVISRLKPGVHYRDMQVLAHAIAANGLLELGILHNGTAAEILKAGTTLAFFPHGLGHHMGLEVHDVLNIRISAEHDADERNLAASEQGNSLFYHLNHPDLKGNPICNAASSLASVATEVYATLTDAAFCMAPVRTDSPTLKEGMVITVEPGIYFSPFALRNHFLKDPVHSKYINKDVLKRYMDVGGIRIEDDILITTENYENLTTAPKGDAALHLIRGEEDSALHPVHPQLALSKEQPQKQSPNTLYNEIITLGMKRREMEHQLSAMAQRDLFGPWGVEERDLARRDIEIVDAEIERVLGRLGGGRERGGRRAGKVDGEGEGDCFPVSREGGLMGGFPFGGRGGGEGV
ncbi:hypothetical protein EG327_004163 [Venturia inaequalis]|uniref:Xaa-Pro aminopeptidase n=1 Tax=Venturia inaequalis TaxID=5025 RepID=A0A8H3VH25_VENIN|nr:hypothetical protein EG327_004163 [Venturia inaequalis]